MISVRTTKRHLVINTTPEIRALPLSACQGPPRSETTESDSRELGRQSKLKSHGWSPEDWVPVEKWREDWYPGPIVCTDPKSPFPISSENLIL
jgi:hypothetical protein